MEMKDKKKKKKVFHHGVSEVLFQIKESYETWQLNVMWSFI